MIDCNEYHEVEMEMPTPCQNCGNIFDLNDGCGSDKWYPGTVICEKCADIEEREIELEDEIEECKMQIGDAEYAVREQQKWLIILEEKMEKCYKDREERRK